MLSERISLRTKQRLRYLPFLSMALLTLIAIMILACPFEIESVNAEASTEYLPSTVSLTMAAGVSASVEPTIDGVFKTMGMEVGIQVSSADAFSVSLHGDTVMRGTTGNNATINPVAANSTAVNFRQNQWGYSWAEGNAAGATYDPVPAEEQLLVSQSLASTNNQVDKIYTLGFGAKVSNTLPADTYRASVTVSVVATPKSIVLNSYVVTYDANGGAGTVPAQQTAKQQDATWSFIVADGDVLAREGYSFVGWSESPTATTAEYKAGDTIPLTATDPEKILYAVWKATGAFNGLTTMQGMTADACKNAKYGETARLEDIRDGKKYWVTKLADGNCWMTQNLDFDITTDGLSITNGSNVDWYAGSNWEGTNNGSSANKPTATNKTSITNNSTVTNTNSWDQGYYVYSTPTESTSCGVQDGISACVSGGSGSINTFINVGSDYMASNDPDFTRKNNNKPADTSAKVYDAHYLIGNYYSFNAATAGTGASVTTNGVSAKGDICPKGWELPSAGAVNNNNNSFYKMLVAQGMTGLANTNNSSTNVGTNVAVKTVSYDQNGNPVAGTATMTINNALTTAPLFFVRSGYVHYNSKLYYTGSYARYWSRSAGSVFDRTYVLSLESADVWSSYDNTGRYPGQSVRCLYVPTE